MQNEVDNYLILIPLQAPVVEQLGGAICRRNHYPVDKY